MTADTFFRDSPPIEIRSIDDLIEVLDEVHALVLEADRFPTKQHREIAAAKVKEAMNSIEGIQIS